MGAKNKPKETARERCLHDARMVGILTAVRRQRDKGFRLLVADLGSDALEHLDKIPRNQRSRFLGAMLAASAIETKSLTRIFYGKPKSG